MGSGEPEIRSYHLTISGENVKAGSRIQDSEFRSQKSEARSREPGVAYLTGVPED
jgi:hypothetical protein